MFRSLDARGAPLATLRALRTADFSLLLQSGGPMFLPARYRSFHVVGIPLARDYAIARGAGADAWRGRLTLGDVSLHAAGPGERLTWPEGATCLYMHLRPGLFGPGTTIETQHRLRDRTVREIGMALLDLVSA